MSLEEIQAMTCTHNAKVGGGNKENRREVVSTPVHGGSLDKYMCRTHQLFGNIARRGLLHCFALLLFFVPARASKTADVSGVIYTVSRDNVQNLWPKARVVLKNLATGNETATVSGHLGAYAFRGLLPGDYEITVTLAGFDPNTRKISLKEGDNSQLDLPLILAQVRQSIEVTGDAPAINISSTNTAAPALTATTLRSTVRMNQDFQDALPLLPGVVRDLDGQIRIKGGRTNQTSTLVNTASVADPFTGQPALRLPAIAVQSVQVLSNPFSAEYGRFASGVVEVATRGGTDTWKWLIEDPIPRFRWIDGTTHGVSSASPHLTFAGPIRRGQLYLFQSLYYGYDTTRVYSLLPPDDVRVQELVNTYTQLDWNSSANQRFSFMLTIDPLETKFANIDTFNPQPVTENYRQRSFFGSATHRLILARGGFIQSLFSSKRLDSRFFPADSSKGAMTLFPEQNSGTFFESQNRRTRLYQWGQTFHAWPMQSAGRHLLTFGYSYARSTFDGQISNMPVHVLRSDGSLSSAITFDHASASAIAKNEVAVFVQDTWQIHPRLTVDLGIRFDHDSISAEPVNVAPRIGFVLAPTTDGRTAFRGGFGAFFDKIPINVANFRNFPARTVTSYAADSVTVIGSPLGFLHVVGTRDQRLRVPYQLGWTVQLDRELRRGLVIRLGYEHREGYRDFYVDRVESANTGQFNLHNNGRQRYREFLVMARWQPTERTSLYTSYVHSRAEGELNDYNQFFGNFPYPLIRPNQFGLLSSDAPNRLLLWGIVPLPKKFDFVPVLDAHTGFPYSRLDENWNYVGNRNQEGRFPTFVGLDTKLQYPVDFTFRKRRIRFRAGLTINNVLNHFNPREVQQYGPSPQFGHFYNSVGRQFRIDGDFDF
jgi:hypothetical protein